MLYNESLRKLNTSIEMIAVSATWIRLETYKYLVKNFRMKNKHFGEEILSKPL